MLPRKRPHDARGSRCAVGRDRRARAGGQRGLPGWAPSQARRAVAITAIRRGRAEAAGTKRDPRDAWFWWLGGALPPPARLPHLYARRFGIEHGYKFDKGLLWADPRLRTPTQMERWTDVVAAVHDQPVLARPLAAIAHRPWEAAAPRSRRGRSAGQWPGLLPKSGRRTARPARAGKRPGGRRRPSCGPRRAWRSSASCARGRARPGAAAPAPQAVLLAASPSITV